MFYDLDNLIQTRKKNKSMKLNSFLLTDSVPRYQTICPSMTQSYIYNYRTGVTGSWGSCLYFSAAVTGLWDGIG